MCYWRCRFQNVLLSSVILINNLDLQFLTLIRLGYFGGWKDWGGGGGHDGPPLEISAVDHAIAAKISTMVVCDVFYKIVYI